MSSRLAKDMQTDAPSDDALLAAIGAGDQHAASVFIRRHGAYVLHICRSKLQNEAEAEEAVQDIFASVWRNAGKWQSEWRQGDDLALSHCRQSLH